MESITHASPREAVQEHIVRFLADHGDTFNAPDGVLYGFQTLPRGGKLRIITFGIAGRLTATIRIYSADHIDVGAAGSLAWAFAGRYDSAHALISRFSQTLPHVRQEDYAA